MSELLAAETKVFQEHRNEWLRDHAGAFVAIRDQDVAGFFSSYADAFKAGLRHFGGSRNFLIRQVWQTDPVYFIF